jgi:putative Ca2+/H+ antiporter (TMEM165/GDT1 family)
LSYLAAAAIAFGLTFLGELPDKSLFASLVLGTRYRPLYVWTGAAAAFAVHMAIAVTAGQLLALAPRPVVDGIVAALFLAGPRTCGYRVSVSSARKGLTRPGRVGHPRRSCG